VILRILCACVTRLLFSNVRADEYVFFPSRSQSTTIEVFLDSSGFEIFAGAVTC